MVQWLARPNSYGSYRVAIKGSKKGRDYGSYYSSTATELQWYSSSTVQNQCMMQPSKKGVPECVSHHAGEVLLE